MSTNAYLALETKEGYIVTYCHWDGMLNEVGRILNNHYQDRDKVESDIADYELESISSLGINRKASEWHNDGERDILSDKNSLMEYVGNDGSFLYVFSLKENEWFWWKDNDTKIPLKEIDECQETN